MTKGLSIHIGLNSVDPNHYKDQNGNPWPGHLVACESDARAMQAIADKQGFASLSEVEQAVLEPGGTIAFIGKKPAPEAARHQEIVTRLDQIARELAALRAA